MTAIHQHTARLLTVAEYAELDETEDGHTELQEGHLLMSPSPLPRHSRAFLRLAYALIPCAPQHLEVLVDVDVDLELAPAHRPGFVRRPDVLVVDRSAAEQVDEGERKMIRASEVVLAVEIVSPGSRRMDYQVKRSEYADAGIPHYWIVDLDRPVSLLACHLAGHFGYQDSGEVTGTFQTTEPFPVTLDLDKLR